MQEIRGSVGAVSPIENGKSEVGEPSNDSTTTNGQATTKKSEKSIYRRQVNGKTVYPDAPCDGARSKSIEINESSGVEIVNPGDVRKFRAQALSPKPRTESPPVPAAPPKVGSVRAQCDDLEKYIRHLDEYALQPLPGSEQDRIKRERKETRQKMFNLDCMHA